MIVMRSADLDPNRQAIHILGSLPMRFEASSFANDPRYDDRERATKPLSSGAGP
jgi:hypothetical protein